MEFKEIDVLQRIAEIENDPKVNLKVPVKLIDPDVLVIAATRQLSLRNEHTERSLRSEGVLYNSGPLHISVSPKNVDRSLKIFDTLIKALRARGHDFEQSTATIGEEQYDISIREKLKRIENDYRKSPTGDLVIKVHRSFPRFEVYDSKTVLIEEKIARVIAKMELDAAYWNEVHIRNAKRQEEKERQEKIREEYEARKVKEMEGFKKLLSSAKRQFEAKLIREYIQSIETKANQNGSMNEELRNWIAWAHDKADWYDPLVEKEDELLVLTNL